MSDRSDRQRYARYQEVLETMVSRDRFSLKELKEALGHLSPSFVTRVVRDLARTEHLRETKKQHFEWARGCESFASRAWLDAKIYGPRLTRTPKADRPRERLMAHGAQELRTAELLAILIWSGRPGESALQAGEKIAARFADEFGRLPDAGRGELKNLSPAVADTAYCQIMAGIELGRRVERAAQNRDRRTSRRLRNTGEMVEFCGQEFQRLACEGTQEEFQLVCLDTKRHPTGTHKISVGLLDESLIGPREVFRPAIREAAAAVVLVHNHPSGDPTPSPEGGS